MARRALGRPWSALGELRRAAGAGARRDVSLDFHGILKSALMPAAGAASPSAGATARPGRGPRLFRPARSRPRRQTRYDQALGLAEAFGASRGVAGLGRFRPALKDVPLPDPAAVWDRAAGRRLVLVPGASRPGRDQALAAAPLDRPGR